MIDASVATLLAGGLGIAGSILGVVLGAILQRHAERADRVRREELAALERLELHLKRIAAIVTSNVMFPSPIAAYHTLGVLRDVVYADPSTIPDDEAARELLDIVQEAVIDVTPDSRPAVVRARPAPPECHRSNVASAARGCSSV